MPPQRIIAVVVTYNRRDMVTRLVAALDAGKVVPDEVVVVDNASTDGTAEALAAAGHQDATDGAHAARRTPAARAGSTPAWPRPWTGVPTWPG